VFRTANTSARSARPAVRPSVPAPASARGAPPARREKLPKPASPNEDEWEEF
jgi:hypothetical protein